MARFDWAEAAKHDYVVKHGSVPFWVGMSGEQTLEEKREIALRVRLQALLEIVGEYAQLAPFEQQRRYHLFFSRLCQDVDEERDRVRERRESKLLHAIDEYEAGLLAILKGLRPRPSERLSGLDDR